ncbi:MAG: hypothetical protein MJZ31_04505 [Bacteroidales bacterium]|nr:hypothetical protein [Bacteroidales bacterium]
MASVTIKPRHITIARRAARTDSTARIDGRSIFIKRYPGNNFKIIMVHVTKKQRRARDIFADAQRLAKDDYQKWNRIRHWRRIARTHKHKGGYRAAVSFYYRLLLEHGDQLKELHPAKPDRRLFKNGNSFYFINFDNATEYRNELLQLCG